LTEQAVGEIEYLMTLLPTIEEFQQMEEIVGRLANLPAAGQYGELNSPLNQALQKAASGLEGSDAPDTMSAYSGEMAALSQELDSTAQQMSQALTSGNKAAFASLADQMSVAIGQTQQQLAMTMSSLVSGYNAVLSELEASIESVMP